MLHLAGEDDAFDCSGLHSKYVNRAIPDRFAGGVEADNTIDLRQIDVESKDYDECLACQ